MRATETTCTTGASAALPNCQKGLSSSVTALVIEQALAELGVHATLSDLVRGAQLFESAISNRALVASRSITCAE
jgi:hypothetical protein